MCADAAIQFHVFYSETLGQLETYAARVAENRDVMAALDFARYVINARLDLVLAPFASAGPLKVDGSFLRWKAEELQRACQDRFRTNDCEPRVEALQLQSIHEKLNLMAGYLSKFVPNGASPVSQLSKAEPHLQIISGGRDVTTVASVEPEHTCLEAS